MEALAKRDVEFRFEKNEVHFTRALDSQRPLKKAIFGAGFLISDKKATKLKGAKRTIIREKNEKAEKIYWKLSDREKEIIKNLG